MYSDHTYINVRSVGIIAQINTFLKDYLYKSTLGSMTRKMLLIISGVWPNKFCQLKIVLDQFTIKELLWNMIQGTGLVVLI